MPSTRLVVESPIVNSPRVQQVSGMFDVPPAEKSRVALDVDVPIDDGHEWSIGLIVGPSGSGKSLTARHLFGDRVRTSYDWDPARSILDGFPSDISIRDVVAALSAVGFSSPPAWLRPYHVLSMGEQFRVTVARALFEQDDPVVIDEFTSVVDRQVAQVASHAVQKHVRRSGRKLVAVSCHSDIVDWLQPDWIYQPTANHFVWRSVQHHPDIELAIYSVDRAAWPMFAPHHYLSADLSFSATCFGAWIGDACVAFNAYIHLPHARVRDIKMGHRLVVLPDYQGLGIGLRFDDWLGTYLHERGYRYHKTISHPALIASYRRSPHWRLLAAGRTQRLKSVSRESRHRHRFAQARRLSTYSFAYVPSP